MPKKLLSDEELSKVSGGWGTEKKIRIFFYRGPNNTDEDHEDITMNVYISTNVSLQCALWCTKRGLAFKEIEYLN